MVVFHSYVELPEAILYLIIHVQWSSMLCTRVPFPFLLIQNSPDLVVDVSGFTYRLDVKKWQYFLNWKPLTSTITQGNPTVCLYVNDTSMSPEISWSNCAMLCSGPRLLPSETWRWSTNIFRNRQKYGYHDFIIFHQSFQKTGTFFVFSYKF